MTDTISGAAIPLGEANPDARGNQILYRLEPPITWTAWGVDGDEERQAEYVIVSAADVVFSGPETYIFPADEDGNITAWGELEGSFRGGLDHEQALRNAGYEVRTLEEGA